MADAMTDFIAGACVALDLFSALAVFLLIAELINVFLTVEKKGDADAVDIIAKAAGGCSARAWAAALRASLRFCSSLLPLLCVVC